MLIRCTKGFRDFEVGMLRSVGETWEASPERLAEINAAGYGKMAEAVPEPAAQTAAEQPEADSEPVNETAAETPETAPEASSTQTAKKGTQARRRAAKSAQRG